MQGKWMLVLGLLLAALLIVFVISIQNTDNRYEPLNGLVMNKVAGRNHEVVAPNNSTKPTPTNSNDEAEPVIPGQGDYIVDCGEPDYNQFQMDGEKAAEYFQSLTLAKAPQEQLAYALFSNLADGVSRLGNLLIAQAQVDDPMVSAEIIRLCSVIGYSEQCDTSVVNNAVSHAPNNRNVRLNAVYYFAKYGTDDEVLQSIQELSNTAVFANDSTTLIDIYTQSLNDAGIGTFPGNTLNAFGIEAAQAWGGNSIIEWCKKNLTDPLKADACLTFLSDLEKRSKLIIWQNIAVSMKRFIYENIGNIELAKEAEARLQKTKALMNDISTPETSNLLSINEKLARAWVKNRKELGEIEAFRILEEDAIFLSRGPKSLVCGQE
jgi:hypothetical protein